VCLFKVSTKAKKTKTYMADCYKDAAERLQECMEVRKNLEAHGMLVDEGLQRNLRDACNAFLRGTHEQQQQQDAFDLTLRPASFPNARIVITFRAKKGTKSGATMHVDR
jgi:alpha-D-ribose 1-methylphosphonate 5-triphosphate synthase subunit PhnI